jgi:hypothetical protein
MYQHILFIILFICSFSTVKTQVVYEHVSNEAIYEFLDELANEKLIHINTTIKPYSRELIASKLLQADSLNYELTKRQQKELKMYLAAYNLELDSLTKEPLINFYPRKKAIEQLNFSTSSLKYSNSFFKFSIRPIFGYQVWNNENMSNSHRWNGLEAYTYMGNLAMYANLRDNHEETPFSDINYLDSRPGAVYKARFDNSEMRGGISYQWKWGEVALVKDHLQWGNHYHYPNIISEKAPSFTQFKYKLKPVKWFEINYFHAKLVSSIVDSAASYNFSNAYDTNNFREVFRDKYMAGTMLSFTIMKNNTFSVGNSVVYGDRGIEPAFLIPIMLYKSVDHTLIAEGNRIGGNNRGQNSQLFFDFSIRAIKHVHLYYSLFMDDLSFKKIKQTDHFNLYSINTGIHVSNLLPNMFFTFEYFKSTPLTYQHDFPTTSYESNLYNMGHYMIDNSQQFFVSAEFRPIRGLSMKAFYKDGKHGLDHDELGTEPRDQIPFMQTVDYTEKQAGVKLRYQIQYNTYLWGSYVVRSTDGNETKYTNPMYYGNTSTLSVGLGMGF